MIVSRNRKQDSRFDESPNVRWQSCPDERVRNARKGMMEWQVILLLVNLSRTLFKAAVSGFRLLGGLVA